MPEETPDPDDLLAPAEALAAMLRGETDLGDDTARAAAVAKLAGVEVIVRRQGDLAAAVSEGVAKSAGAAIIIALDGWADGPQDNGDPFLALRHSISVWTVPIYREGLTPETVVLGALVRAVHAWIPDAATPIYRWRVGAGTSGEGENAATEEKFNVNEFEANFEVILYPES